MRSTTILGLAGLASLAAAADCDKDWKITTTDATLSCDTITGSVTVDSSLAGSLNISGPKKITGDLTIKNATNLISITSTTITQIGGSFTLEDLNQVQSIRFSSLDSINEVAIVKAPALRSLVFGTEGVTKASTVRITNTNLDNLSSFKLSTVDSLTINDNPQMAQYDSALTNITTELVIRDNGENMEISMTNLTKAGEIQIGSAKSLKVPALKTANSVKFEANDQLESFSAPNLTEVKNAISFTNNPKLTNVSFPVLTKVTGDLKIVNNTEIKILDGFPVLTSVETMYLGGSFEEIDMPKLNSVNGLANASSTTDIQEFCKFFDSLKSANKIKGSGSKCTSNYKNANGGSNNTSSGNNTSSTDDSAAGFVGVNVAVLGLALVAGVAHLL